MSQQRLQGPESPLFKLEYPQSVGLFNSYAEAQKAVDNLADQDFPVKNLAIVGTDLKLMERVTGRRTWGTVLSSGVMTGLQTGFIVAVFMMLLVPGDILVQLLTGLVVGVGVSLLFAIPSYAVTRGQRDFTSITQTVATRYEILCEHKVAGKARELLSKTLGASAFAPAPRRPQWGGAPGAPGGLPPQGYPMPQPGYGTPPPGYGYPPPGYGYPPPGYPMQGPGPMPPQQPWGPQPGEGARTPPPEVVELATDAPESRDDTPTQGDGGEDAASR